MMNNLLEKNGHTCMNGWGIIAQQCKMEIL